MKELRRTGVSSKIGGFNGSQTPSGGAGRPPQRPQEAGSSGTSAASSAASGPTQDVQITGAARQLATLEQTLRDLPAVNETRVAQIANSIEQGTYRCTRSRLPTSSSSSNRLSGSCPTRKRSLIRRTAEVDPEVCRDGLGSLLSDESTALGQLEALLQREHDVLQAGDVAALEPPRISGRRSESWPASRSSGAHCARCMATPPTGPASKADVVVRPRGTLVSRLRECAERAVRCRDLNDRRTASWSPRG